MIYTGNPIPPLRSLGAILIGYRFVSHPHSEYRPPPVSNGLPMARFLYSMNMGTPLTLNLTAKLGIVGQQDAISFAFSLHHPHLSICSSALQL